MFSSNTSQVSNDANYIEDVFSTYLYTGNGGGSATGFYGTQTIANGVDLSTKGGMVWLKARSSAEAHALFDTARGVNKILRSDYTFAQSTAVNTVTAFNTTGFNLGSDSDGYGTNTNAVTYASWTFRKQPKFFDVVTYTGTGSVQNIAHNLGSTPGCIIVKDTTNAGSAWAIYHTSLGNTQYLQFTTSAAGTSSGYWNNTSPTSTQFTVGTNGNVNQSGATFVAYLFAHDAGGFGLTGTDNVISCGSCLGSSINNLGFEPQWVLVKSATSAQNWYVFDNMRGLTASNPATYDETGAYLWPNSANAEATFSNGLCSITSTGFDLDISSSQTYIYIAIRRGPMKVPTDATKVFAPVTQAGGGFDTASFPVDLLVLQGRNAVSGATWTDRLRGSSKYFNSSSTAAESSTTGIFAFDNQTGVQDNYFGSGTSVAYWNFRRAPSFFDEVCFSTDSSGLYSGNHNLGVTPELLIFKTRGSVANWQVVSTQLSGAQYFLRLNSTIAQYDNTNTNYTASSTAFTIPNSGFLATSASYVGYLFATCAGVSKCTAFTGTGTLQTINCGFTSGARFVLIKRTDAAGDWYVWDSARGISSSTDPYLLLNSTAAEVTSTNWVDTTSTGFQVTAASGNNVNINGASYIALAIA